MKPGSGSWREQALRCQFNFIPKLEAFNLNKSVRRCPIGFSLSVFMHTQSRKDESTTTDKLKSLLQNHSHSPRASARGKVSESVCGNRFNGFSWRTVLFISTVYRFELQLSYLTPDYNDSAALISANLLLPTNKTVETVLPTRIRREPRAEARGE